MNYTPIHNRFWSDGWVRQLNALDRYLFLYLLTNGRAQCTGIYELPLDMMATECGIDEKDLRLSMLQRLEPKVYYKEGWVIIMNFIKHRVSDSPALIKGILNEFEELPPHIKEIALQKGYPLHTLPRPSRSRVEQSRVDTTAKAEKNYTIEEDGNKPKTSRKGYESMVSWAVERRGNPFLKGSTKQYSALKLAKENGITSTRLKERWIEFESDPYWEKKGFDWMNVVTSFNKKP